MAEKTLHQVGISSLDISLSCRPNLISHRLHVELAYRVLNMTHPAIFCRPSLYYALSEVRGRTEPTLPKAQVILHAGPSTRLALPFSVAHPFTTPSQRYGDTQNLLY